jgi:hypothetical protein
MEFTLSGAEGFRAAISGRPGPFCPPRHWLRDSLARQPQNPHPTLSRKGAGEGQHVRGNDKSSRAGAEPVSLSCAKSNCFRARLIHPPTRRANLTRTPSHDQLIASLDPVLLASSTSRYSCIAAGWQNPMRCRHRSGHDTLSHNLRDHFARPSSSR